MLLEIYVKYIELSVSGKVLVFRSDFENLFENRLRFVSRISWHFKYIIIFKKQFY